MLMGYTGRYKMSNFTAHYFQSGIVGTNFASQFTIDLSIARTAALLGLIIPARTKVNGLYIVKKGSGHFRLSFRFHMTGSDIGLTEAYFDDDQLSDKTIIPYEFVDLVITNTAQPAVENPICQLGLYING